MMSVLFRQEHWQRILTGGVLITIVIATVLLLSTKYAAFLFALLSLGILWEWVRLITQSMVVILIHTAAMVALMIWAWIEFSFSEIPGLLLLAIACGWWFFMFIMIAIYHSGFRRQVWLSYVFMAAAPLVIAAAWFSIVYLHYEYPIGLLYLFAIVMVADTAAYYSGRLWGKRKLMPNVSPGKTTAGLWGALGSVLLLSGGIAGLLEDNWLRGLEWILASLLIAMISVIGDLAESLMKRYAGKKDSGSLLPGHGGLLDRTDSLLAAAPVFLIIVIWL